MSKLGRKPLTFDYQGRMLTLEELAQLSGVGLDTIRKRILVLGWTIADAVATKVLPVSERRGCMNGATPVKGNALHVDVTETREAHVRATMAARDIPGNPATEEDRIRQAWDVGFLIGVTRERQKG